MKPKTIGLRETNQIIRKIKDPDVKRQVSAILFNSEEKVIYCQKCKKEIGIVDLSGKKPTYIKEDGILSARQRFDGNWGFECSCGNDSRLAESEKGIITSQIPTKDDLEKVFNKIKKKPTKVKQSVNMIEIDGFEIRG